MGPGGTSNGPPQGTTLFAWVKQTLREEIARGAFATDQPFVTQREIVERFGVSTTTAVRALNDLVAEGLVVRRRGRGTFVADPPRSAGPEPATGQRTVAFVSPNEVDAHQVAIRAGIAGACAAVGDRLVTVSTAGGGREEDLLRRAVADGATGVIAFLHDHTRAATAIDELRREGTSVVLVDRYLPTMPTDAVIFDDFAIGYEVTTAVLERGHRALAMLWGEEDATSVRDRLSGHYRALRDRRLPELPERSALRDYFTLPTERRLDWLRSLIESGDGLTAVIGGNAATMSLAASDLLALPSGFPGVVELATMDGLGPYDVSPLAVVSATLPARELGATAGRLLQERMVGSDAPLRHVVLGASVHTVERGGNRLSVTSRPPSP